MKQHKGDDSPLADLVSELEEHVNNLNPKEIKVLENFFNEKLVSKHDMKESLKELEMLFDGFKLPELLLRKIVESFIFSSETNYFEIKTFI